jgi:hypothetical protein
MEELTDTLRVLTTALVGEAPVQEQELEPLAPCPGGLSPEQEEAIAADALELLDTPWEHLSVVELRALLRALPIDRTALPAPIEFLRRHELVEALLHLPAVCW